MGFLDSLKTWFRSETAEAKDLLGETSGRLTSDLDRREAELAASPSERIEQLQEQIAEGDGTLDALRDKIEGRGAKADAVEELSTKEGSGEGSAEGSADDAGGSESDPGSPSSPTG